ncbi:hypothetical protein EV641_10559 [Rhodococcus sp. SMB37]|uniref:hypothetical protein n=1 Tax=Rhodococcus sp. SMB37 TaxID=2512213 RepID=UPI0010E30CDE|nr:hypothetical protein [Rhodococcus sp. SMB37]TCN54038.1 hypothetical protein EV641_10559 [Rhodococcus sp. SMB37]
MTLDGGTSNGGTSHREAPVRTDRTPADLVDDVASTVLSISGIAGLHGGEFGEIATYLPGRRVAGIRLGGPAGCEIHVIALYPADLPALGEAVRRYVEPIVDGPVRVVFQDIRHPLADQVSAEKQVPS